MPSPSLFPEQGELWNRMLADRLSTMIRLLDVATVVFDGTFPYQGVIDARLQNPDVTFVWCRRGRWKQSITSDALEFAHHFRLVLEPGELLSPASTGPSADVAVAKLPPILLLDREELADRSLSSRELGLAENTEAVLIQLGAGNINSLARVLTSSFSALRESEFRSAQMCWSGSPISKSRPELPEDVRDVSHYPISRYFNRFRFGISAAGYNSFHEHIVYGLPAIFIPNAKTVTDDQYARALSAQKRGLGVVAEDESTPALQRACERMSALLRSRDTAEGRQPVTFVNGAHTAADMIESLSR